jgi:hypothetical protein
MYRIGHFRFPVGNILLALIFLAPGFLALPTASSQTAVRDSQAPSTSGSTTSDGSLAAAARDAKTQKASHAKKVFTDEDMEAVSGPLPKLRMEGAENGDEVVAAIAKYKGSHTPEQTEQAVRIWYERYDEMLAGAIQENLDIRVLREANQSNGYELCQQSQDYQKCQSRQMAEMRGARNDQLQSTKNGQLEVRIQHVFGKVRAGLMQNNLRYDWFKIRTTNGIDVF